MRSAVEVTLCRTLELEAKEGGARNVRSWRDEHGDFHIACTIPAKMFEDALYDGIIHSSREARRLGVSALRYAEWLEKAPHQLFVGVAGKWRLFGRPPKQRGAL